MREQQENIIVVKSKKFALSAIDLYKYVTEEHNETVLSKQFLRSGTSIGANIKEGIRGQSKADFVMKLNIALKEASESEYWLELLEYGGYIPKKAFDSINQDCIELIKLLTSIIKTSNKNK